jgi:hypothetical protein
LKGKRLSIFCAGSESAQGFGETVVCFAETFEIKFTRNSGRVSVNQSRKNVTEKPFFSPPTPCRTSRLTANRMLRIRKVIQYLCDKIDCTPHPACIGSTSSSAPVANDGKSTESKKVYIELYCQGKVCLFRASTHLQLISLTHL